MKTYFYTVFSPVFDLDVTVAGKTRKVNPGEALVLSLLASVTQHGDGSWHGGQAELAAATGMPERTARAALAVLVEAGYVAIRKETVLREGSTPLTTTHYTCLVNFETKATPQETPKEAPQEPSEETPKEPTPAPVKASRKAAKAFVPPTADEVAEYAATQGAADFDASYFVSYYAAADWRFKDGKPMKAWKQTVLTWLQRDRKAAQQVAAQVAAQQAPQYKEAHITF